ncbi:unnamed protein product [Heterobilharzia americana]|nr:unnamed protein product [Heterobilharzia americana]
MFKKFLSVVTDYIIGNYVENFNFDNLSYGLLDGKITLSNLTLKKDTLNSLFNIPLTLESGKVGNVSIFIPYTHPWSQAWQLTLENVDLVAYASADDLWHNLHANRPRDGTRTSVLEETSKDSAVKYETSYDYQKSNLSSSDPSVHRKYSLDQMEKKWFQTINGIEPNDTAAINELAAMGTRSDNSSWWSYISSVGYGIIRSLQIEIRQVRISLIDPSSSETEISSTSLFDDNYQSFGTFTINLQHLTMETTDSQWKRTTITSEEPVEYKLINVDGLNIIWEPKFPTLEKTTDSSSIQSTTERLSDNDDTSITQNALYVLHPCHLTGRLKRNQTDFGINGIGTFTTKYQTELNNKAQIELSITLSQLNIQISEELCYSLSHLSEILTSQYKRTEQLKRRPSTIMKRYKDWWRYAAGEIRPQLRVYFHSTLGHTSLLTLATEAKLSVTYVKAYTAYLINGLLASSSDTSISGSKCLITVEQINNICDSLNYTPEMNSGRLKQEQIWPIQRITILRLIAMRRAAVVLYQLLKFNKKDVCENEDALAATEKLKSLDVTNSPVSNRSWYGWWRYSSWLRMTSFLSSTTLNEVDNSINCVIQSTGQQSIGSDLNPPVTNTIFELLDEFAAHASNIDYTCITYPIFLQFVCTIDGCSLKLVDRHQFVNTCIVSDYFPCCVYTSSKCC